MNQNQLLESFIEIEPLQTDSFLKVRETLTRIGILGRISEEGKPTLWQSCYILHKGGRYYIVHFKQLFLLDGKTDTIFSEEDSRRTQSIAYVMQRWGMITPIKKLEKQRDHIPYTIIPYSEKSKYTLLPKYHIGKKIKEVN